MNSKSFKCIRVGFYEELINKINSLENENKNLKNKNEELLDESIKLNNKNLDVYILNHDIEKLKKDKEKLNEELKKRNKINEELKKNINDFAGFINELSDEINRHKNNAEYLKACYEDELAEKTNKMNEIFDLNQRIKVLNNNSGLARINTALYTQNKKIIKDSLAKLKTIETLNKEVSNWQEKCIGLKNEIHDEYRNNVLKREAYYDKMGVNPTKQCSVCFEDKPIKHCLTTTCDCNIACCKNCAIHIINSNDGIFKCPTCRNYEHPSVAI